MNQETKKVVNVDFYEPYAHFSRTLRAWLVAYGVGVPVILISQANVIETIKMSGKGLLITYLFLGGVLIQVLASLIYKYSMGYLYASELDPSIEKTNRVKLTNLFSEAFWLELCFDVSAIALFFCGTFIVVKIMLGS